MQFFGGESKTVFAKRKEPSPFLSPSAPDIELPMSACSCVSSTSSATLAANTPRGDIRARHVSPDDDILLGINHKCLGEFNFRVKFRSGGSRKSRMKSSSSKNQQTPFQLPQLSRDCTASDATESSTSSQTMLFGDGDEYFVYRPSCNTWELRGDEEVGPADRLTTKAGGIGVDCSSHTSSAKGDGLNTMRTPRVTVNSTPVSVGRRKKRRRSLRVVSSATSINSASTPDANPRSSFRGKIRVRLSETIFPHRTEDSNPTESYITLHEVDEVECQLNFDVEGSGESRLLIFAPQDAVDVLVPNSAHEYSYDGALGRVKRWPSRCIGKWTAARILECSGGMVSFQMEYDDKTVSNTFGGYLISSAKTVRRRGLYVLQDNADLNTVVSAVNAGLVAITHAAVVEYPKSRTMCDQTNANDRSALWPSFAKQIAKTLLLISVRLNASIMEHGPSVRSDAGTSAASVPVSLVLNSEVLVSMILAYLPLLNAATHTPIEEFEKHVKKLEAERKKLKKELSNATRAAGTEQQYPDHPGGSDWSSCRKRPKNERRLEMKLTLLRKAFSNISVGPEKISGKHLLMTTQGVWKAMDWDDRLDKDVNFPPKTSHERKPLIKFFRLLEHVAEHNYNIGFVGGPYRPRIARDDNPQNPWAREPELAAGEEWNVPDSSPFPRDFSLRTLMESVRPGVRAPLLEGKLMDSVTKNVTLSPEQSKCVRWMISVESKEFMEHVPPKEGEYAFRPICLPSSETIYIHTVHRHLLVENSDTVPDAYPVGGILVSKAEDATQTAELIALMLLRPRPPLQYENTHFSNQLRKMARVASTEEDVGIDESFQTACSPTKKKLRSYNGSENDEEIEIMNELWRQTFIPVPVRATLLIVPQCALELWKDNIFRHAPHLSVMVYTGIDQKIWALDFAAHDVVLTTYHTLREDEHTGGVLMQSPLVHCDWWRIILDKSQVVRTVVSAQSLLIARMTRQHAWCTSPRPLSGRLSSLLGLLEVLDFDPAREALVFNRSLLRPYELGSYYALARVYRIMQRIMWRSS